MEIVSVVCCRRWDAYTLLRLSPRYAAHHGYNFVIKYLDEIETKFDNTLVCLSGVQMGEKNENILTN